LSSRQNNGGENFIARARLTRSDKRWFVARAKELKEQRLMLHRKTSLAGFVALLLTLFSICLDSYAQTDTDLEVIKKKVAELTKETRYTEALPLLEKIVAAEPKNAEMVFQLGFALIARANAIIETADKQALRVRARNAFIRAKELGLQEPVIDALIGSLPPDGSDTGTFSQNLVANAVMVEAESLFGQGKLDDALKDYQKALSLDPKLYHAALFSGDVYMQRGDLAQASAWYEKAIAIDPTKETAYRYSATPLMKQGKTDAARERYIEAFISEPYNRFARAGLIQWGQLTQTTLGHPQIDIPTKVTFDEKGNAQINLDASALLGEKDDGSFAWISYGVTRSTWRKEKFAKVFPNERVYRHSLAEEADALRSVIVLATGDKKTKKLSPSLAKLKQLDDEGFLEAYILLAQPDDGIAADYIVYLKANREKLHRYVAQYVIGNNSRP
jgi:tetratricopeptide (TPR) repeat protein